MSKKLTWIAILIAALAISAPVGAASPPNVFHAPLADAWTAVTSWWGHCLAMSDRSSAVKDDAGFEAGHLQSNDSTGSNDEVGPQGEPIGSPRSATPIDDNDEVGPQGEPIG